MAEKLVVQNIGLVLSGALEAPIIPDADSIVAVDGRIVEIGKWKDCDTEDATTTIDAHGVTVAPGLIDSHVHPVAGDWTPARSTAAPSGFPAAASLVRRRLWLPKRSPHGLCGVVTMSLRSRTSAYEAQPDYGSRDVCVTLDGGERGRANGIPVSTKWFFGACGTL